MRILIVTNLYPPQELGGYGRSMADFAWGFLQQRHHVSVLCSNAPYLQSKDTLPGRLGPSGEIVDRRLMLKGSYQNGVSLVTDPVQCAAIDQVNQEVVKELLLKGWDGVLVGNVDLLGPELLEMLLNGAAPVVHHVGFMDPPFPQQCLPQTSRYTLAAASFAVRANLRRNGFPVDDAPVVYPGVRTHLFGDLRQPLSSALRIAEALYNFGYPLGSAANPLKVGFAGLLMGTKGVHTLIEALTLLHHHGVVVQACLAGSEFQTGYQQWLQNHLNQAGMQGLVQFVGQLQRPALSRFWDLQHVGVFSSIYPEAFGIVAAEVMASGAALVTSAVGGAAELVPSERSGLRFSPGQAGDLAEVLHRLLQDPQRLFSCAREGQVLVRSRFDVLASVDRLEQLFYKRRLAP